MPKKQKQKKTWPDYQENSIAKPILNTLDLHKLYQQQQHFYTAIYGNTYVKDKLKKFLSHNKHT